VLYGNAPLFAGVRGTRSGVRPGYPGRSRWIEPEKQRGARGHMTQHLLLGMYAPLALVLGAPAILLLAPLLVRARPRVDAVCGPGRCTRSPTRRLPWCSPLAACTCCS
jgi:Cytochrome c oxidase caa3 assembly factor (Caa3_CtaG)